MKRALSVLLALIVLVYVREAYDVYVSNQFVKSNMTGTLSDIAEEVIAIPLKTAGNQKIEKARNIRQVGADLFLISDDVLYRFTAKGNFVCRITNPEEIRVAGYVLNQSNHELIVLGNQDDIFYYTYDGELKSKKKLKSEWQDHRMHSFAMVDDKIWTIEEGAHIGTDTMETVYQKRVVMYDSSFHKLHSFALLPAEVGRNRLVAAVQSPRIMIDADSGLVYAYSPGVEPDDLLQDTLYIQNTWRGQLTSNHRTNTVPLFPLSFGNRFWIASYCDRANEENCYTFCYDNLNQRSYQAKGGLKDDFFHTGTVSNMEVTDVFGESYAFCKSGKSLQDAFPGQEENAVVFIIKLKA